MEQFNIKISIYKYGTEPMIHGFYKISKKENPNFQKLIEILGTPRRMSICKCKTPTFGWNIGEKVLVIED